MKDDDSIQVSQNEEGASCELDIRGMTCAACKGRVERALGRVPGVQEVDVNLLTERATVRFDPVRTTTAKLVEAVAAAGYEAAERAVAGPASPAATAGARADEIARREREEDGSLRRDVWLSAILTAPLLVLGMSHGALPGTDGILGQSAQLALATACCSAPVGAFCDWGGVRSGIALPT